MSEQQLWRACLAEDVEIRAAIQRFHAAQDSGALFGAELQITIDDQVVLRELFVNERQLHLRSIQLFERVAGALKPARQ